MFERNQLRPKEQNLHRLAAVLVLGLIEVLGLGLHHLLAPVLLEAGPRPWYLAWWRRLATVKLVYSWSTTGILLSGILVLVSSLLTGTLDSFFLDQVLEVAM